MWGWSGYPRDCRILIRPPRPRPVVRGGIMCPRPVIGQLSQYSALIGGPGPGSGAHHPTPAAVLITAEGWTQSGSPGKENSQSRVRIILFLMSSWHMMGDGDMVRMTRLTPWPGSPGAPWPIMCGDQPPPCGPWHPAMNGQSAVAREQWVTLSSISRHGVRVRHRANIALAAVSVLCEEELRTLDTRGSLCDTKWHKVSGDESEKW